MPFGLTALGDPFQYKLDGVLSNLDFCIGIVDDMIIWGEQPDGSDHDKHLTDFCAGHMKVQSKTKH